MQQSLVSIGFFLLAFVVSLGLTLAVREFAGRLGIMDDPSRTPRKLQKQPVPLLGGLGIIGALIAVVAIELATSGSLFTVATTLRGLVALVVATLILAIGGVLDDRFDLPARLTVLFPVAAAIVVIAADIGIKKITNPFGGTITIELWQPLTFLWLLGMIYTTKLLDGVDGLATSITAVGAVMIALLASSVTYFQPEMVRLSLIFFGALVGFLVWNLPPATVYLGEVGSTFIGFFLGVLSIVSGSKIATALLVMGVPALDVAAVVIRRAVVERRSIFSGDRNHLHHLLMARGLSDRATVALLTLIAASFGILTLLLQARQKLIALIVLLILAVSLLARLHKTQKK